MNANIYGRAILHFIVACSEMQSLVSVIKPIHVSQSETNSLFFIVIYSVVCSFKLNLYVCSIRSASA